MNVTYRTDSEKLYIALEGRIDASNAPAAETQVFSIIGENPGKKIVIDADQLAYISSAGLRVILKIRKGDPELAILNVSPEVYEVFEMTGFTDMVTVEKAFPRMSVEGCEFIAKGANGAVYRYDDETIVKVFFAKDVLPDIQQERENARKAFVLGINTAIPYGVVRVGDGYGLVTELLNAKSVTRLIRDNPEDLETPANYYVDMLKSIHGTEVKSGTFPDMRETALDWAKFLMDHLPAEQAEKLHSLVEAVPCCGTVLHGDYNTNNIMIQNGEPILIDMDTLCMGHPVFEMGSMFNAFQGFSEVDPTEILRFMGYDRDIARKFWRLSLKKYFDTEDEAFCDEIEKKAMVVGYMRLLRRTIRRPNEAGAKEREEHYRKRLIQLLSQVDSLDF